MAAKPSVAIFVHAGDLGPTVFSTACSRAEQHQLRAWLDENPELEELVERAWALAESAEAAEGDP